MSPDTALHIAWIDVETTGLDPHDDLLLEIACIVTDADLTPIALSDGDTGLSVVVDHDQATLNARLPQDDYVRQMHEGNGLLADIAAGRGLDPRAADFTVADYITAHTDKRPLLGGNSITLDRNMLSAQAPTTFAALHYRSLDVTSVRELVRRMPELADAADQHVPAKANHRALADIRRSLESLRTLRAILRGELN